MVGRDAPVVEKSDDPDKRARCFPITVGAFSRHTVGHAYLQTLLGARWHLLLHCESIGSTWSRVDREYQCAARCFQETRAARPFDVIAAVVMPNHLHCIWTLPEGDADNARRWSQLKSAFSRRIPYEEFVSPSRIGRRERGIWQRRFWERYIVDENDLHAHIDYIHYSPVKHGFVTRAFDWPHSSFRRWVSEGL